MAYKIDEKQIARAIHNSIPLTIKTYSLPHETEEYIEEVLGVFCKILGQEELKHRLGYCIKELAVNAKKANTKRVYFEERDLSLDNETDYQEAMENFKEETLNNIQHYLKLQKKKGLYIKVVFHVKGDNLTVAVKNNVEITKREQMRAYDRIARSRVFSSLEEALSTVMDSSEGAGLGLVILILMLKKIGLDEENFDLDVENGETVARLVIPVSDVHLENVEVLSNEIVNEINALPQFPETIVYLQKLISDPDSEISDIARQISTDPSLTADLLKLVNSAQFMLPQKVDNIVEAVKLVGLRGIKNLLYSYGTQQLLGKETKENKQLWEHSYRCAYYAYNLAKSFKRKKDIIDDIYVGGILHDMGKIIFSNVHPNLMEKIRKFTKEKEIPPELFESLSSGLNHAEIGARVAEKWNFPDPLIASIRYHHNPTAAPKEFKDIVFTVYMANSLCNIEEGMLEYNQLDQDVLKDFDFTEDQIKGIIEKLSRAFNAKSTI
ncbi:MAG: HDOD domain-containing protein [Spirochaetia bacterium]